MPLPPRISTARALLPIPGVAPETIPNVAGVWYDDRNVFSDDAGSIPAAIGVNVALWRPVAGSLPAFAQTDPAKRPTRQAGGMAFDGSADVMSYTGNALLNATSRSFLALVSAPAMTATRALFSSANPNWYVGGTGSGGLNGRMISSWGDAGAVQRTESGGGVNWFDGMLHVYVWRHATAGVNVTVEHWRDWTPITQAQRTDGMLVSSYATWHLGAFSAAALFGAWTIRALALFDTAISDALRDAITHYWKATYRL